MVTYELVTVARDGKQRVATYASEVPLKPGDVIRFKGRDWLVERIEDGDPQRLLAKPARYRLRLVQPDGREELGAFRRYRPDGPLSPGELAEHYADLFLAGLHGATTHQERTR